MCLSLGVLCVIGREVFCVSFLRMRRVLDVVGAAWWMYNELERCGQELMVRGSAKSSREGAPMWCGKRLRVAVLMAVGC